MRPTVTRGATNLYSAPENWDRDKDGTCGDLQVRRQFYAGSSRGITELISTWKPSGEELKMLNEGGVVELSLLAGDQPPCSLYVVAPVSPAEIIIR